MNEIISYTGIFLLTLFFNRHYKQMTQKTEREGLLKPRLQCGKLGLAYLSLVLIHAV